MCLCCDSTLARLILDDINLTNNSPDVVVVSDVYGQRGGAYRVTSLLCHAIADCGFNATCFATWVDVDSLTGRENFSIVQPLIKRGSRWDLPNRALAWQVQRFVQEHNPVAVIVIGLTKVCGYLLNSRIARQLLVWELTNAKPGNKFVDGRAAQRISRCGQVLSPAVTIDAGIRATYGYTGPVTRMPFWIEDEIIKSVPAPDKFAADFLFLARREDDKGLRELIHAASSLQSEFPAHRILIAGPGDETPYRKLAEQLCINNCVSFCSLPGRIDAMQTLAASRFLVLPSYHEGYPLSLLEAAQYGVPFVATDVGSVREVFGDCEGCRIIPPRDADALAKVMKSQLLMGQSDYLNARNSVHQRFLEISSGESVRRRLQQLLADVAGSGNRRQRDFSP